jgi:hypothetical protein
MCFESPRFRHVPVQLLRVMQSTSMLHATQASVGQRPDVLQSLGYNREGSTYKQQLVI